MINLEHHGVVGHMAITNLDLQIRKRRQQVAIVLLHRRTALVPVSPRRMTILRVTAERSHDTREIMPVLKADLLLNRVEALGG